MCDAGNNNIGELVTYGQSKDMLFPSIDGSGQSETSSPLFKKTDFGDPSTNRRERALCKPVVDENGKIVITPEMRELAEAVAHPKGDPYLNGRNLGFYCEQCG